MCAVNSGPYNSILPREDTPSSTSHEINLLLPDRLYYPLWKSLLVNFRDRFLPENLPPLQLTSRPIAVIVPLGEILKAPWYRTIFTNLGDVIAPENLPALELESRPVDVGELVSDRMSQPWWSSLLRNFGDLISPEHLPPLELESQPAYVGELIGDRLSHLWWTTLVHNIGERLAPDNLPPLALTSKPVNPGLSSFGLQVPLWSSLVSAPAIPAAEAPRTIPADPPPQPQPVRVQAPPRQMVPELLPVPIQAVQVDDAESLHVLVAQFKDSLSRSRRREILWVATISVELLVLLAWRIGWL
jgi:hypothetical protein